MRRWPWGRRNPVPDESRPAARAAQGVRSGDRRLRQGALLQCQLPAGEGAPAERDRAEGVAGGGRSSLAAATSPPPPVTSPPTTPPPAADASSAAGPADAQTDQQAVCGGGRPPEGRQGGPGDRHADPHHRAGPELGARLHRARPSIHASRTTSGTALADFNRAVAIDANNVRRCSCAACARRPGQHSQGHRRLREGHEAGAGRCPRQSTAGAWCTPRGAIGPGDPGPDQGHRRQSWPTPAAYYWRGKCYLETDAYEAAGAMPTRHWRSTRALRPPWR